MIDSTLRLLALAAFVLLAAAPLQAADSAERYISDRLTVPLRSGPTNGHRIVHRGLPAGTKLSIIERASDSNYVRIRTARGTEGWLEEQYLDKQPIARQRLRAAQAELQRLQTTMDKQSQTLTSLTASKGSAEQNNAQLQAQVEQLTQEYEALQAISKGAVAEHAENRKLKDLNERLRNEVTDLADERDALRSNAQQRWLLTGGGLALLGLLLGVLIKARPRRSAWT
ncbi:MAG: TIGR04211 family SH3 domain-containing protein [Pseudomonadales bacterium]